MQQEPDDKACAIGVSRFVSLLQGFPEPVVNGSDDAYAFLVEKNRAMDRETLVKRLQELRDALAKIDQKLKDLNKLLDGEVTDETVRQYADGLRAILDEREPIINEARQLILLSYQEAPDDDVSVN